jgi:hypothetical protein
MSCYFRHIKDVFEEAGLDITKENKKDVDRAIHKMVGVPYKDCSATWKKLKQDFLSDDKGRSKLAKKLGRAL